MKNILPKFVLFFSISIISLNLFAQTPPDPGDDPLSPSNNFNQKVIIPRDSINQKHTDTSKVLTVENLLPVNYLESCFVKTKISAVYSEENTHQAFADASRRILQQGIKGTIRF